VGTFEVDPSELDEHASELGLAEPFLHLAQATSALPSLPGPSATAAAVDRLRVRLRQRLEDLSTATGSLSNATRSAADGYQTVESSIVRSATP
jgi:hypothetical protein